MSRGNLVVKLHDLLQELRHTRCKIQAARCKMHVHLAHVLLQELQDAVGTTVGAGVNLTGQLTRAAVPVAQGIVGAVREVVEVETCITLVL